MKILVSHAKHQPAPSLDCLQVASANLKPTDHTKNIGVILDSNISFDKQIEQMCKSAFHSIRSISRIRKFLSMESAKTLVHAFVTSKLVNCNALLYGLPKYHIQRLQYTLNSDTRLVTLSQKHDHISPVLMELHQLPVEQHVGLKILSFSPRVVNGWHLFISGVYL